MIKYERLTIFGIASKIKTYEVDGKKHYKIRCCGDNVVYDIYAPANEQINKHLSVGKNIKVTGKPFFYGIETQGKIIAYCRLICRRVVIVDNSILISHKKKAKITSGVKNKDGKTKKMGKNSLFNEEHLYNIKYEEIEI